MKSAAHINMATHVRRVHFSMSGKMILRLELISGTRRSMHPRVETLQVVDQKMDDFRPKCPGTLQNGTLQDKLPFGVDVETGIGDIRNPDLR